MGGKTTAKVAKKPKKPGVAKRPAAKILPKPAASAMKKIVKEEVAKEVVHKQDSAHVGGSEHDRHRDKMSEEWLRALKDPFTYVAPSVGSTNGSAVVTTRLTAQCVIANANDVVRAVFLPRGQKAFGYYYGSTGAFSEAVWNFSDNAFNAPLVYASPQGRLMAGGIRMWVQGSNNDKPGQWAAGSFPFGNSVQLTEVNVPAVLNMGSTAIGPGQYEKNVCSAMSTWTPLDNQDGEFATESTFSASTFRTTNVPYLFATGFPVTTTINIEYVQHIECIQPNTTSLFTGIPINSADDWTELWDNVMSRAGSTLFRAAVRFGIGKITQYMVDRFSARNVATGSAGPSVSALNRGPGADWSSHGELRESVYDGPWLNTQTKLLEVQQAEATFKKRLLLLEERFRDVPSGLSLQGDSNPSVPKAAPAAASASSLSIHDDEPLPIKGGDGRWFIPSAAPTPSRYSHQ